MNSTMYVTRDNGGGARLWSEKPQFDDGGWLWHADGPMMRLSDVTLKVMFPDINLPAQTGPNSIIQIKCSYGR